MFSIQKVNLHDSVGIKHSESTHLEIMASGGQGVCKINCTPVTKDAGQMYPSKNVRRYSLDAIQISTHIMETFV